MKSVQDCVTHVVSAVRKRRCPTLEVLRSGKPLGTVFAAGSPAMKVERSVFQGDVISTTTAAGLEFL